VPHGTVPSAGHATATDFDGEENPYETPHYDGSAAESPAQFDRVPICITSIDPGDVMSRSWRLLSNDIGQSLLVMLVYLLISFLAPTIGVVVVLVGALIAGSGGNPDSATIALMVAAIVMATVGIAILFLWIQIGATIYFLKLARGQSPAMGDLFSGGRYLVPYGLATVGYLLLVTMGTSLCIVPGILAAVVFFPWPFLVIDRDMNVGEAFFLSYEASDGNKMSLFVLLLVYLGISTVAGMLSILGSWLVSPYLMLLVVVAYLAMTGQHTRHSREGGNPER